MLISKHELVALNEKLETLPPQEILQWAANTFPGRVAIASSMQKPTTAIIHMAAHLGLDMTVVFVDTGVHFPETLALRDELIRRWGVRIHTATPAKSFEEQYAEYGRHLYMHDSETDPPGYQECCELRKELPFLEAVRGHYDCVLGGLTRSEGGARKNVAMLSLDPRLGAYRLYPLANWTSEQIDEYIAAHDIPVHPLYAQGYASIGCRTCTTPIKPGEPKRAGRWRHIREKNPALAAEGMYCGLNLEDKKPGNTP